MSQRIGRDVNSVILLIGLLLVTIAIVKQTRSEWLVLVVLASLVGAAGADRDGRTPPRQQEVSELRKR